MTLSDQGELLLESAVIGIFKIGIRTGERPDPVQVQRSLHKTRFQQQDFAHLPIDPLHHPPGQYRPDDQHGCDHGDQPRAKSFFY
jgi:hypothetical protein